MARDLLDHPTAEPGTDPRRLSRRAAWMLVALCAWTLYVWITRVWIIAHQHNSAGFVAVHVTLAVISIAFGLAAGYVGWRRLRIGGFLRPFSTHRVEKRRKN